MAEYANLSLKEKEEIYSITGISGDEQIIEIAEDRYANFDIRLRDHPIFDEYRNNPEHPLVAEIFADDVMEWPGYRYKELTDAMGGVPNFLKALQTAYAELPIKGTAYHNAAYYTDLSRKHSSGLALSIRPRVPGSMPLPDEGFVALAVEHNLNLKFPTDADIKKLQEKGRLADIDLSYFEYPDKQTAPSSELRLDLLNPYFDTNSVVARAWQAVESVVEVPQLDQARSYAPKVIAAPFLLCNDELKKIQRHWAEVAIQKVGAPIHSLAAMEAEAVHTHGSIFKKPKKVKAGREIGKGQYDGLSPEQAEIENLIKKTELLLRFAEAATQKTLHNRYYADEPIIVDARVADWINPMMKAFNDYKAMSLKPSMIFDWVTAVNAKHVDEIVNKLLWGHNYIPPEQQPPYKQEKLTDEAGLQEILGEDSPRRFRMALIGGASVSFENALRDTRLAAMSAAENGMDIFDGAGTRPGKVMGAMREGSWDALQRGFKDFSHVGIRVPLASRREGNVRHLFEVLKEQQFTMGDENAVRFNIGENYKFDTKKTLAGRQHLIEGPVDAMTWLPSGIGGFYEGMAMAVSNLYIKRARLYSKKEKDMFPGFVDKVRPIFQINSLVNSNISDDRFYDFMSKIFTPRELELMDISIENEAECSMSNVIEYRWKNPGVWNQKLAA